MVDWDEFSTQYDDLIPGNPHYIHTLGEIVDSVEYGEDSYILDLGCGTGNNLASLAERFTDAKLFGVDPSQGMRRICENRFSQNPGVEVRAGDALDIPFPDEKFDYLVSNIALHHVEPDKRGRCALELFRVLKKGGKLVYSDMFLDVDGPPEDSGRCRDVIQKLVAGALYCLDHGKYETMIFMLRSLPPILQCDGEYFTTSDTWLEILENAGFRNLAYKVVTPVELGVRIITGIK